MKRFGLPLLLLLFLLSAAFPARAYYNPGKAAGFINDYAGILTTEQKDALETKLSRFDQESSNEIAVVTISSLEGDTIEGFAVKLFEDWGIGKEKKDNGLLLLIAVNDRQMRIETGYGLEGALPDATAYQIITKTLRPAFQNQDYYGGINQAVDQMMAATRGEYQAEAGSKASASNILKNLGFETVFWIMIMLGWLLSALRRRLAKSRAWWEGGAIGLAIGLLIALLFFRVLIWLLIIPVSLAILGLIFDYLVSRVLPQPRPNKRKGGFWIFPGGGFGGGSSGGGFGGFGGGSSGGGGASGSW